MGRGAATMYPRNMEYSDCVVIMGSNMAECHPVAFRWPVKARVTWSRITGKTARWEQAFSADGGQSWEVNWISDFTRTA